MRIIPADNKVYSQSKVYYLCWFPWTKRNKPAALKIPACVGATMCCFVLSYTYPTEIVKRQATFQI